MQPSQGLLCFTAISMAIGALMIFRGGSPNGGSQSPPITNSNVTFASLLSPALDFEPAPPAIRGDLEEILASLHRLRAESDLSAIGRLQHRLDSLLTPENAARILQAWPEDLPASPFTTTAFNLWAEQNPGEALQWLASTAAPAEWAILQATTRLITRDPAAMRDALASLPSGENKQRVMKAAITSALLKDRPEDAAEWIAQLDPTKLDPGQLEWTAAKWGQKDIDVAIDWIIKLRNPGQQDRMLAHAIVGHADQDPAGSLQFLRDYFPPGEIRDRATADILAAWADLNPPAATTAFAQLPFGEANSRALDNVLASWSDNDPGAVRQWVLTQPTGPGRDAMIARLGAVESRSRPRDAAILISDELPAGRVQAAAALTVLKQWVLCDAGNATAWAQSFPEPLRKQAADILKAAP